MEIKYRGHKDRTEKARELWLRVATDYNGGMSAEEIAKRYGKSRIWVYFALRKLREETVN